MSDSVIAQGVPDQREMWESWHTRHAADGGWIDADGPLVREFLRALPDVDLPVLDLGCGQCTSALYAEENARDARSIYALDFSAQALQLAQRRLSGHREYPVVLQRVDIGEGLPFADQSVRGVYAHLSLHYFDAKGTDRVFAEALRVCAPGGILAVAVKSVRDQRYGLGERIEQDVYCLKGHIRHFFSEAYLADLLSPWRVMMLREVEACDPGSTNPSSIVTGMAQRP